MCALEKESTAQIVRWRTGRWGCPQALLYLYFYCPESKYFYSFFFFLAEQTTVESPDPGLFFSVTRWRYLFPVQVLQNSTDTWGLFLHVWPLPLFTAFSGVSEKNASIMQLTAPRGGFFPLIVLLCAKHSKTVDKPAWLQPLCSLFVSAQSSPEYLSNIAAHLVTQSSALADIWSCLAPFRSTWTLLQEQPTP